MTERRLFDAWRGVLWDGDGRRVLPTTATFDEAMRRDRSLFSACQEGPCGQLFHIPTVEWINALAAVIDVEVLACDDGSWEIEPRYCDVVQAEGLALALEWRPKVKAARRAACGRCRIVCDAVSALGVSRS